MHAYLDNAATTPIAAAVLEEVTQIANGGYGNPSARHGSGLRAASCLRQSRAAIAAAAGAEPDDVIFTSGGSEAIGLGLSAASRGRPGHVLFSAIEHDAVMRTAKRLADAGHQVEQLEVTTGGWVDPATVRSKLRDDTRLVAVMHVNNESGIEQPINAIANAVRQIDKCVLLVDAVQSFARLPTRLDDLGADLLCLSAHKFHGPAGVGCLIRRPGVKLRALWLGGGQEQDLRAGTQNLPAIAGLARAVRLPEADSAGWRRFGERLFDTIYAHCPKAYRIGEDRRRVAHILSIGLPGIRADALVNALSAAGVYVSSGSACHSRGARQSHVTRAMRVPAEDGVLRFSFGRQTDEETIDYAVAAIDHALPALRR